MTEQEEKRFVEQEQKTLETIVNLLNGLDEEESWVRAAFAGCADLAIRNMRDDTTESLFDIADRAKMWEDRFYEQEKRCEHLEGVIRKLSDKIDIEQEWRPFEFPENVSDEEYARLRDDPETELWKESDVIRYINRYYGFVDNKIIVRSEVNLWEKSRHGEVRTTGQVYRPARYKSAKENYVRFDVCGVQYELFNDILRRFVG